MKVLTIIAIFMFSQAACAVEGWICTNSEDCNPKGAVTSKPAGPKTSDSIKLNPAAVPVENVFGVQVLSYKGSFDFALVKGMGRVGAAISPSNNEETFFGAPGFELPDAYESRIKNKDKFQSNKTTLAGAWNVVKPTGSGLERRDLNLGAMIKLNGDTGATTPGLGFSGSIGFVSYGYSIYADQSRIDFTRYGLGMKSTVTFLVETYSIGVFFQSLIVDFSVLRLIAGETSTTSVGTGTLLLGRYILTTSLRTEDSNRARYDFGLQRSANNATKSDAFLGLQYRLGHFLIAGAFYNYYLLHELSVGATVLF